MAVAIAPRYARFPLVISQLCPQRYVTQPELTMVNTRISRSISQLSPRRYGT